MSRQWHPLFARLLGLLIEDYYKVEPEVPVSDLPRRGDLLLVRRQGTGPSPFVGLWGHLTGWNVVEFKGPTDDAEEDDLELLMHVGTGLTYRLNEERKLSGEPRLANHEVSFWYLAPKLGETFIGHAQGRVPLVYETGGVWRGRSWGHPVWFVSYTDTVVEEDTIPLRLLSFRSPAPRQLGELVQSREDLARRFANYLRHLHPRLWKEIGAMSQHVKDLLDYEALAEVGDLDSLVPLISPEKVVNKLSPEQSAQVFQLLKAKLASGPAGKEVGLADASLEELQAEIQRRQAKP